MTSAAGRGLQAVLWDMDGLLVDSEPLWTVAEEELFASLGATFTMEVKAAIVGHRLDTAVPMMLAAAGSNADPATVGEWLIDRMVELYHADIPLLPGAGDLLSALRSAGIPCALVSSSFRRLVDAVCEGLPPGSFRLSVAGDEVAHAKPHPEPYSTAAARLGVDPAGCVVLEDAPSGARSGSAAGCAVVVVPNVAAVEPEPGWTVLPSLRDVGLDTLTALVG